MSHWTRSPAPIMVAAHKGPQIGDGPSWGCSGPLKLSHFPPRVGKSICPFAVGALEGRYESPRFAFYLPVAGKANLRGWRLSGRILCDIHSDQCNEQEARVHFTACVENSASFHRPAWWPCEALFPSPALLSEPSVNPATRCVGTGSEKIFSLLGPF